MADSYRVQLESFEGPLDLLLHLIKKSEVEIADIPVAIITEQYLGYLDMMKDLHLDVAGEFLVMAATLTLIKSRSLLPLEEEEEEEEDPRANLVQQLLEYQRYREAALDLSERPMLRRDVYARDGANDAEEGEDDIGPQVKVSLWDLMSALKKVIERAQPEPVHEVEFEQVSLRDRCKVLLGALRRRGTVSFASVFDGTSTKIEIIVTFLALLEFMKMGVARAVQVERHGEIMVELAVAEGEAVALDAIDEYSNPDLPTEIEGEGDVPNS